ncbi:hypothetical protein HK100_012110 [Physocladia obscura]|uniref:Arb2 domain-containing protein n=1 Tax=Physocladia obscura TaxID=109957 RepID=A0AAD5XCR3_9FUNG|nr:hypothetical protein HK100_012110 [Physocladia obscura]
MSEQNPTLDAQEELAILGYRIDRANGERLVRVSDGKPFDFNVKPNNHSFNQRHYEKVGDVLTHIICNRLVRESGLVAHTVPVDAHDNEPCSTIYMSADALSSKKPLLLLVPGSNIQVGQWARKIVINENVYRGSMLEYVDRAHSRGWVVIVLNNNLNSVVGKDGRSESYVRGSESPEKHVLYAWKNFVSRNNDGVTTDENADNSGQRRVVAVAHSYGGACIHSLCTGIGRDQLMRDGLVGVALTDSVHAFAAGFNRVDDNGGGQYFAKIAVNWICRNTPLDTKSGVDRTGVKMVSAGTLQHDQSTLSAIDSVFKFLEDSIIS